MLYVWSMSRRSCISLIVKFVISDGSHEVYNTVTFVSVGFAGLPFFFLLPLALEIVRIHWLQMEMRK